MQEHEEKEELRTVNDSTEEDIIDEDEWLEEDVSGEQPVEPAKNEPKTGTETDSKKPEYALGIAAMVLGILSLLLFCIPVLGLVLATVAIILGIVAAARDNGKKMGISGIVMGSIGMLSYLIIILFFGGVLSSVNQNRDYFSGTAWRNTTDGSVLYLYSDGTFIDVEQEGEFSDNFYAGTYDVLDYEDTGLNFSQLQKQYDTDYAYDICLYVKQYVNNGEERQNIANTMRYLYFIEKGYESGEIVMSCPHDSSQYGSMYPMRETSLAYPTIGNQYLADSGASSQVSTETEEQITTEAETAEQITTESATEVTTESTTEVTTEAVVSTEGAGGNTAAPSIWGDVEDFFENSKESWNDFGSSASESWEDSQKEISSAIEEASSAAGNLEDIAEEASSAMEEASSAMEDASSAIDELLTTTEAASTEANDSDVTEGIQKWLERLVEKIQNWIASWTW